MELSPKTIQIKDGTKIVIRPLSKQDGPALLKFFASVPEDDRIFLKDDVTKKEIIDRWITELDFDKVLPMVAEKDSAILGDATLHFNRYRWQLHMAEIRCVVARKYQQKGLGTALMRELVSAAQAKDVSKIRANMMDTQKSAQSAFQRLGFKKEAELKDFLIDKDGNKHNLILMVNDVSAMWGKMEDLLFFHDIKTME
ncbi:MAG: GNAT family N-acetyltransferase [Acidobacteria bacterium]|nr:GNAT family N-acetyltransferase [Acidobacteriota bacterium]